MMSLEGLAGNYHNVTSSHSLLTQEATLTMSSLMGQNYTIHLEWEEL